MDEKVVMIGNGASVCIVYALHSARSPKHGQNALMNVFGQPLAVNAGMLSMWLVKRFLTGFL